MIKLILLAIIMCGLAMGCASPDSPAGRDLRDHATPDAGTGISTNLGTVMPP